MKTLLNVIQVIAILGIMLSGVGLYYWLDARVTDYNKRNPTYQSIRVVTIEGDTVEIEGGDFTKLKKLKK